jgi:ribosomal protein S18 acetylase RimI-like enzyme
MANTPFVIRTYRAADEDDVVALWQTCNLTRPWNDPRRDIARKLTQQPELFLVAVLDNTIAGTLMAGFDGHRGWVWYLGVLPEFRRNGMARALMGEAERRLTALGCPKLNLQVRSSNQEVLAFYRALGYGQDDVLCFGRRLISDTDAPHSA